MKEAIYISNSKASARKSKNTLKEKKYLENEASIDQMNIKKAPHPHIQESQSNNKRSSSAIPQKKLGMQGLYNEWMILCASLCLCFLLLLTSGEKIKKISESDGVASISQYLKDCIDDDSDVAVFFGFSEKTNKDESVVEEKKDESENYDVPVFVYGEGLGTQEYIDKYNSINYNQTGQVPVFGVISSEYAFRKNPFYNTYNGEAEYEFHSGIDIAAAEGTPILCYLDGTVEKTMLSASYGYYVSVDHGGGLKTLYAHASKLLCEEGDEVRRGEVIALVGSTGRATGPHLHFEVISDGFTVNPKKYLGELYEE